MPSTLTKNVNKSLIICILGPTASGKTKLAIQIANRYSCDQRYFFIVDRVLWSPKCLVGNCAIYFPHAYFWSGFRSSRNAQANH